MDKVEDIYIRDQLLNRREKLTTAISKSERSASLEHLLNDEDTALEKMDKGTYGL